MKKLFGIISVFFVMQTIAQPGMYRHFPQPTPTLSSNGCEIKKPIRTADGGYLFGYLFWLMGFEFPGGPSAYYVIKTDSNFVPEWKKPNFSSAVALPTGGIILVTNSAIEKVTRSGTQVWRKEISGSIVLNDGVSYSDKIRFVGKKAGLAPYNVFWVYPTSEAYSLLMDTASGNIVSQTLFSPSYTNAFAEFSKIQRDASGDFFVYSSQNDLNLPISNMSLVKFDTSFNFVWGKTWGSSVFGFFPTDIDILPNGRIFCTGMTNYNIGTVLLLNSQGNIVSQSYFPGKSKISGLCKKQNGNYVISITKQDSLFMFEMDTSMSVSWNKLCSKGSSIGTSYIKNNQIITPIFYGHNPILISNDLTGGSCASLPLNYSQLTSSVSLTNFTLTPLSYSATANTGTLNLMNSQTYVDSCKCPVFIPLNQNVLCVGMTGTINIIGSGILSWYETATGNSFIQSGSQFLFSSLTPTTKTIFAQDSICGANPNRTQIDITVYNIPTLSFSPINPTICAGDQAILSVSGANNYHWSNGNTLPFAYLSPTTNVVYTVTGANAPGCSDTKTVSITVVPRPILSISPTSSICFGSIATFSATGALSYSWYPYGGGTIYNGPSFTINPLFPGQLIYTAYATTAFCDISAQTTLVVVSNPVLSVTSSPSLICAGKPSTLTVSGANSYTWSNSVSTTDIVVTPNISTTYSVSGTSIYNCASSETIHLIVFPQPTLSISSAYSVCEGAQVTLSVTGASTYTWSSGLNSNSYTLTAPIGNSVYTVSGANGVCTKTASTYVYAFPHPTITFASNPTIFCEGKTTTITAFGASTFTWSNFTNNNSLIVTPTVNVSYTVTGSNGYCSTSDSIHLLVHPVPTLTLSASNSSICANNMVTLLANGSQDYLWNTGSTVNILYQSPQSSSSYTVTGTNTYGCSDTKTIGIIVHPLPLVYANSSQPTLCIGEQVTLSATGAHSYSWNSGDNSPSLTISPNQTTTYTVVGLSAYGCINQAYITQVVTPCTGINSSEKVNTIFSFFPNPFRDDLKISCETINEKMHAEIFNALGQVVMMQKITEPVSIINLKDCANGIYYIKVIDGKSSSTQKVIKQ